MRQRFRAWKITPAVIARKLPCQLLPSKAQTCPLHCEERPPVCSSCRPPAPRVAPPLLDPPPLPPLPPPRRCPPPHRCPSPPGPPVQTLQCLPPTSPAGAGWQSGPPPALSGTAVSGGIRVVRCQPHWSRLLGRLPEPACLKTRCCCTCAPPVPCFSRHRAGLGRLALLVPFIIPTCPWPSLFLQPPPSWPSGQRSCGTARAI